MSEIKIWKCDRCGNTWNSDDGKNPLEVVAVTVGKWSRREEPSQEWHADWCEECRIATGVFRPQYVKKEQPDLPKPLTLEEMIREIANEEIDAR